MKKALIFLTFSVVSVFAFAEEPITQAKVDAPASDVISSPATSAAKSNYMMCKNKNIVRTVRIDKKGRSCRTTYTKEGVDTVVGKSGSPTLCQNVFDRIIENLEKAAWKCKDITQARVSTSISEE